MHKSNGSPPFRPLFLLLNSWHKIMKIMGITVMDLHHFLFFQYIKPSSTQQSLIPTTWGLLHVLFFHFTQYNTTSSVESSIYFGLPFLLTPSTCTILVLIGVVIDLHCMQLNHLNWLSQISSPIGATPKSYVLFLWMPLVLILSFLFMPLIHLSYTFFFG